MLIIRDMEQKDEAVILEMMQDFYNSPACLHTVPEENFRRTLTEASAGNPCVRVLILEEKERDALILLASHNSRPGPSRCTRDWVMKNCPITRCAGIFKIHKKYLRRLYIHIAVYSLRSFFYPLSISILPRTS